MKPLNPLGIASAVFALSLGLWTAATAQSNSSVRTFGALSASDLRLYEDEVQDLLNSGKPGNEASWKNDETGNSGKLELKGTVQWDGKTCQQVDHIFKFKGEADPKYRRLTYCRVGKEWRLAE